MIPAEALNELPVFPLPCAVLFPGTALPLHVFEPRYCAMTQDALAGHQAIAIAMLKNEATIAEPQPEIYRVACIGKIVHHERAAGTTERYNIVVHGLRRVILRDELPLKRGYRRFRSAALPKPTPSELSEAQDELAHLQSCVISLCDAAQGADAELVEVLSSTSDPVRLADILCAVLVEDAHKRQALLEASLRPRLVALIDEVADTMVHFSQATSVQLN